MELGSGSRSADTSSLQIGPAYGDVDVRKGRERAITLSGDEPKPLTMLLATSYSSSLTPTWRVSTGRHDLR